MTETQTETTPATENLAPAEAAPAAPAPDETMKMDVKHPFVGVHAVLKNGATGEVFTVMKTSKKELSKYLSSLPNPDLQLLFLYKGKQLQLKAKTSYSFS